MQRQDLWLPTICTLPRSGYPGRPVTEAADTLTRTAHGAPQAERAALAADGRDTPPFTQRDFRDTLGRFATGVTVVTMLLPGEEGKREAFGITVNAFMSLSLDPPLVAVSIDKRARAHKTLLGAERFGVSVLAEGQAAVSDRFAGRPVTLGHDPYEEHEGFPVIGGALAQIVLGMERAVDAGDHTIFIGRVEAMRRSEGAPLLYFKGAYRHLPEAAPAR